MNGFLKKTVCVTLLSIFPFIIGCQSMKYQEVAKLQVGMRKDEVVYKAGSPNIMRRSDNKDFWIYTFFDEKNKWRELTLEIENGEVTSISYPLTDPAHFEAI